MIIEIINPTTVRAYDKKVLGCVRHKKDIMISILDEHNNIQDVFFTQDQAKIFLEELQKKIKENES